MKKFKIRKRILALLISGNIMLSGCSMFGNVSDKKMESSDASYTQSSIDNSKDESSHEESSKNESSISKKEQSSKEESIEEVEGSIEESLDDSEEESINELSEVESSIDEEETSTKEESSKNESSTEESSNADSSIIEESKKEEEVSVKEESSELESKVDEESSEKTEESSSEEEDIEDEFDDEYEDDNNEEELEEESNIETSELDEEDDYVYTDDKMYIYADDTVNIRKEPNTDCDILGLLYEGSKLKKLGYVGDWYIVDYNGKEAFVSGLYTHEEKKVKTETKPETKTDNNSKISDVCYFPYGSTLYSDKGLTKEIKDIPESEFGKIYKQEGNAYYVETDGNKGYVSKSSATIINDPVVVVDKSEQHLEYYENNNLVLEYPVITGNESEDFYYPTDEGLFTIYSKVYDAVLEGPINYETGRPAWHSEVDVFMEFYNGEGIHDASWKESWAFGSEAYLTGGGSHGCINSPTEPVLKLAEHVQVGKTKVLVKR